MKFQSQKVTANVMGVLNEHLKGEKEQFMEAALKIVRMIKREHIAKEHFRKQRDNGLLKIKCKNPACDLYLAEKK